MENPVKERVRNYWDEYAALLGRIEVTEAPGRPLALADGVQRAIALLQERAAQGGQVLFIGNGGSAAMASHFAMDYWHAGGIRALAFQDGAQLTCLSNDHGYEQVFALPIRMFAGPADVLVAISSSGNSPNILNGVAAARERGCAVITLSGFDAENRLRPLGDLNFYVPAHHYGYVELTHALILHCILDLGKRAGGGGYP